MRTRTNNYLRVGRSAVYFFDDENPAEVASIQTRAAQLGTGAVMALWRSVPGLHIRRQASMLLKCRDARCGTRRTFNIEDLPEGGFRCNAAHA